MRERNSHLGQSRGGGLLLLFLLLLLLLLLLLYLGVLSNFCYGPRYPRIPIVGFLRSPAPPEEDLLVRDELRSSAPTRAVVTN